MTGVAVAPVLALRRARRRKAFPSYFGCSALGDWIAKNVRSDDCRWIVFDSSKPAHRRMCSHPTGAATG